MYARVTLLEIDPLRTNVEAALQTFEETVLPQLREQEGYEGIVVLATAEGRGLLMSLWETEEASEATWAFAGEQLEKHVTLFKAPPGREHYRVAFTDLPALAGR
jgi:heme-degrading monooxygenase HmoA